MPDGHAPSEATLQADAARRADGEHSGDPNPDTAESPTAFLTPYLHISDEQLADDEATVIGHYAHKLKERLEGPEFDYGHKTDSDEYKKLKEEHTLLRAEFERQWAPIEKADHAKRADAKASTKGVDRAVETDVEDHRAAVMLQLGQDAADSGPGLLGKLEQSVGEFLYPSAGDGTTHQILPDPEAHAPHPEPH